MSKLDTLKQSSLDTAAAAKARIRQSYGKVKGTAGDLEMKSREHARNLGEKARPLVTRGREELSRARAKLDATAAAQPLTLLAAATAIGALIGAVLPGRGSKTPPSD